MARISRLRVLDLFAGLGGWSEPFIAAGDEVVTVDLDPRFGSTVVADVATLTPADLPGPWDLILASPPCEKFSVLRLRYNWSRAGEPLNQEAAHAAELVAATLGLIRALEPRAWIMENPRAQLRSLPVMEGIERRTVTYCRLGLDYPKPTDLWGGFPAGLVLPPPCTPNDPCPRAPHGASTTRTEGGGTNWEGMIMRSGGAQYWSDDPRRAMARAMGAKVPARLGALVRDALVRSEGAVAPPQPVVALYQLGAGLVDMAPVHPQRPRGRERKGAHG